MRALMRVVEAPGVEEMVGVLLVGAYSCDDVKHIPLDLIPPGLREDAVPDARFIVRGNLFTKYVKDLYFSEIEVAPDPDPNDGLA
jgi:hypothetical protein